MFTMRTTKPEAGNKNFITVSKGGWNTCVQGSPTDKDCNVLANCVGYASGRFNEIINIARGKEGCTYNKLYSDAENFIEHAQEAGLAVGNEPRVGAICCLAKGDIYSSSDGAGHVFIVEKVNEDGSIFTSESAYGGTAFYNSTRNNSNGRWGSGAAYWFRGFIYLPDDVQKIVDEKPAPVPQPEPTPEPEPTVDLLDLVRRTIRGDFGNGWKRANALGSNYDEVQRQVNLNYKHGTTSWNNVRLY